MAYLDTYSGGIVSSWNLVNDAGKMSIIESSLVSVLGCTVHDTISTSRKVFCFVEFLGAPPVYIDINISGSRAYVGYSYFWNLSTHAAVQAITGLYCTSSGIALNDLILKYCGSDVFFVLDANASGVRSTSGDRSFGFFCAPYPFNNKFGTNSVGAISAGSIVPIPVLDASGFSVGQLALVAGALSTEGRSFCRITAISGNTITVSSVALSFSAGAFVCTCPTMFIFDNNTNIPMFSVNALSPASVAYNSISSKGFFSDENMSSDSSFGRLILSSFCVYSAGVFEVFSNKLSVLYLPGGSSDNDIFIFKSDAASAIISGSASSGSVSSVSDNSRTFPDLSGKYVVITAGTGAGQIRRISSSVGNDLVVTVPFNVAPSSGSTYSICDAAFRSATSGNNSLKLVFRETV